MDSAAAAKVGDLGEVRTRTEVVRGLSALTAVLIELSRLGLVRRSDGAGWTLVRPIQEFFQHEVASSGEWKALHVAVANDCIKRGGTSQGHTTFAHGREVMPRVSPRYWSIMVKQ